MRLHRDKHLRRRSDNHERGDESGGKKLLVRRPAFLLVRNAVAMRQPGARQVIRIVL